ncbi:glycosyltransferase family 25 protein [Helicobacter baculiformis]|uniref:Glycosyltransferase family 25 protein n=1 Tax=Helicobacter baculiformis TaxID=427351 RepID=A0ABV7ZJ90_9HELI|nr:glycosyltransferase family 25 protein [Helicobacter baculiformis]
MNTPTPIYIIHLSQSSRDIAPLLWHLRYLLGRVHFSNAFEIALFEGVNGKEDFAKQGITFKHAHPVLNDFAPSVPRNMESLKLMCLALKSRVNFQSLGQLGCFASHYLLWQECCKAKHPVIVLEDDVLPTFDFYEKCLLGLEAINASQAEIVRLFSLDFKHHHIRSTMTECFDWIFSPYGGMGTQGYILSPQGAQKLLKACPPQWVLPVDTYMDAHYTHHVKTLTLKSYALLIEPVPTQVAHANTQQFKGWLKKLSWLLRLCNFILKIRLFCQHLFYLIFRHF